MIKKFLIATLATFMAIGTFSITEAATDNQENYCCRGGYCYNQNYNDDNNNNDGYCDGGYCRDHGRGCW